MIETESKARVHVEAGAARADWAARVEAKRARDEAGEMRVLNRPKHQIFAKTNHCFETFKSRPTFDHH